MKLKRLFILGICFLMISCNLFREEVPNAVIARVNDNYLYEEDLNEVLDENLNEADSVSVTQNFINDWATNRLLMEGALLNLSVEEQSKFEVLIQRYKEDLYTNAYKDALIRKNLDSTVTDEEAINFYQENRENFTLKEDLIQLRYIHINEDFKDKEQLQDYFINFSREDQYALDSLALNFRNYFLNDSTWVKTADVRKQIPPINIGNSANLLKKTNFLQLRDSLGLYLIAVKSTLSRNDKAPLAYIRPTIDQIILNKRKLELVKQLEKDLKEDAIKDKKFEVYK